ncbi:MAG: hypothetical protein Q7S10_00215 [bacterium]|nr:hypothetical protein [bacterium]
MTKRTRLIILSICAVLFFILIPFILLYSLGYRIDFENKKIVGTGGIYIRTIQTPVDITIDSKISAKTGRFSPSVFIQNLLPQKHTVLIAKEGYFDYHKNVEVKEKEVTKLEHVILFKKEIPFAILKNEAQSPFTEETTQDDYTMKGSALYYSNSPSNASLSLAAKAMPIVTDIITYKASNGSIIWLASDGFLYKSDANGKNEEQLSLIALQINKKSFYELFVFNQRIFLKENNGLLLLDTQEKSFQGFYSPVEGLAASPNSQKLIFYNEHEISYSFLNSPLPEKIFLNRFSEKITAVQWLNDDYLIFTLGGKIMISELDENEPNIITLPPTTTINGIAIDITNPEILFSQTDKKLYIQTQTSILVSEELIP